MFWTLYLVDCLSPFWLVLFLEFCSVISLGTRFFISSFWLPPCVYFYVLGIAALSPGLGIVALRSRCPVGPVVQPPHSPELGIQMCLPLRGLCAPSCYSWALIATGTSMVGIYPKANRLWELAATTVEICCAGADPMEQNSLQQGSGTRQVHPLTLCSWRWLGGTSVWSKPIRQVHWLWSLLGSTGQGQP